MSVWKDFGSYYVHISVPRSKDFFDARKGSISPTKFLTCAGEDPDITREELVDIMTGKAKRVFTEQQKENMERGKADEAHIIERYINANPDKKVHRFPDSQYPVWKQDTYIRGIPDAVILNEKDQVVGILEAKSKYDPKITLRDYYQVLGYMAIFEAKWTDVLIFHVPQNKYINIRVEFDQQDWNQLYSKLKTFKEDYLLPALKGKKFPSQPQ